MKVLNMLKKDGIILVVLPLVLVPIYNFTLVYYCYV
jgi:hypothetical protein